MADVKKEMLILDGVTLGTKVRLTRLALEPRLSIIRNIRS